MKFKFTSNLSYSRSKFLKLLMRTFILLFCSITFAFGTKNGFSQNANITIKSDKTLTVKQVFKLINKQTDYKFIYRHDLIKNAPELSLKKGIIKAGDLLEKCLSPINFTYSFTKNNTVIVKAKPVIEKKKESKVDNVQMQISGKVVDANGQPLPGANILEKGTANGAQTDFDGAFSINVSTQKAVLVVSYLGFVTQEVAVSNQANIVISLVEDTATLDEIVVIGYGSQSRKKVTGAVAQVKSDQFKDVAFSDVANSIAGRLSGVDIKQATGSPGSSPQINIRGISTITAGSGPLIVVDGLPLSENVSITAINPNEIASVEVLKDAASAAIYGSRGSNGVILITTKVGSSGKPEFNFNSYYGFQTVGKKLDFVNAYQQAELMAEARTERGATIPNFIQPYLEGQQGLTQTNWQDHIFVNAPIENHEMTVSGSKDATKYFISGGFFKQDGIIIGSGYERYSLRLNLNTSFSDRLRFGIQINPSYSKRDLVEQGWEDSPISMGVNNSLPFFPVYNADGSYAISEQIRAAQVYGGIPEAENNVAISDLTKDVANSFRVLGGAHLEYDVTKELKAKTYVGGYISSIRSQYFRPSFLGFYRDEAPTIATGRSNTSEVINYIIENTLTYDKTFNEVHNLSVLAGITYQEESIERNRIDGRGFPNDDIQTVSAATEITNGSASKERWNLVSYLGRIQYDYKGKYLVSGTIRRDGSSRFGALTQFGTFPSVSAGWIISEESFFPEDVILSELKLRVSWGVAGNNQIGNDAKLAVLGSADYNFNGSISPGLRPATAPNENLSWEENTTADIGLDIRFFNNKLSLNIDYYETITDGMLLNVPVPSYSGFTSSLQNLGKMKNEGFEVALNYNGNIGPVKIKSSASFATNKNEVLELGPGQTEILRSRNITRIGDPIGSLYGYNIIGIFENQDQLDNLPNVNGNQVIGDYIFKDNNGDGSITSADRKILGSVHPDYTWGFNTMLEYNGIDLSFTFQGVEGVEVNDRNLGVVLINSEVWGNQLTEYYDNRWISPEQPGKYAKPGTNTNTLSRESDLFTWDASFIRVRDITLGYTMPKDVITKIGIKGMRVYASAKNPFMFTKFLGFNPELNGGNALDGGVTLGTYPIEKSIILGINVKL